jgi:hypothetical protein
VTALAASERLGKRELRRFLDYYAAQTQITYAATIEAIRQS